MSSIRSIKAGKPKLNLGDLSFDEKRILCTLDISDYQKQHLPLINLLISYSSEISAKFDKGSDVNAPDPWLAADFDELRGILQGAADELESAYQSYLDESPNGGHRVLFSPQATSFPRPKSKLNAKELRNISGGVGGSARLTIGHVHRVYTFYRGTVIPGEVFTFGSIACNSVDFLIDAGVMLFRERKENESHSFWKRQYNVFTKDGRPFRMAGALSSVGFSVASYLTRASSLLSSMLGVGGLGVNLIFTALEADIDVGRYQSLRKKIDELINSTRNELREITKKNHIYLINQILIQKIENQESLTGDDVRQFTQKEIGVDRQVIHDFQKSPLELKERWLAYNKNSTESYKKEFELYEKLNGLTYVTNKLDVKIQKVKKNYWKSIALNSLLFAGFLAMAIFASPEVLGIAAWCLFGIGMAFLGRKIWNCDTVKKWRGITPNKLKERVMSRSALNVSEEKAEKKSELVNNPHSPSSPPSPSSKSDHGYSPSISVVSPLQESERERLLSVHGIEVPRRDEEEALFARARSSSQDHIVSRLQQSLESDKLEQKHLTDKVESKSLETKSSQVLLQDSHSDKADEVSKTRPQLQLIIPESPPRLFTQPVVPEHKVTNHPISYAEVVKRGKTARA